MGKPSLANALHRANGKSIEKEPLTATTSDAKVTSRTGKRVVAGHFDVAAVRQLKQMALDNDSSIQALLTEALNDLFSKYGTKPIA